jgi:hypothetical protein
VSFVVNAFDFDLRWGGTARGSLRGEIKRAATLVMLQQPTPAREPVTRRHAPSQPLDVITAFAVPDPDHPSQGLSVFSGLGVWRVAPLDRITRPTSDWLLEWKPTLSTVDASNLSPAGKQVNARKWCKHRILSTALQSASHQHGDWTSRAFSRSRARFSTRLWKKRTHSP